MKDRSRRELALLFPAPAARSVIIVYGRTIGTGREWSNFCSMNPTVLQSTVVQVREPVPKR